MLQFFSDEEKEFVDEKLDRTEAELKKISSGMCQVTNVVVVVVAFNKSYSLISFQIFITSFNRYSRTLSSE
jgi:hypothetical protein